MHTEHRDQASFCPFALCEISILAELALGHLRYSLTDVLPQLNSSPGSGPRIGSRGSIFGDRQRKPHSYTLGSRTSVETPVHALRSIE